MTGMTSPCIDSGAGKFKIQVNHGQSTQKNGWESMGQPVGIPSAQIKIWNSSTAVKSDETTSLNDHPGPATW